MKDALGDFTTDGRRLAILCALAAVLGILSGLVAWILLRLIGLITHLAYFGRVGWSLVAPDPQHWGPISMAVPIIGGLLVGLLAKFGTDKIRGHGIPEAIQAILENQSRMEPRVALIKPIASAITIGTGGPFGAEGPIIMTGGAIGSIVSQLFPLSSMERRTLLVAGAAGGMSATFGSPIAAVLLAVELLLFEWRPRSLIPVALTSAIAEGMRVWLMGSAPVFAIGATPTLPWDALIWAVAIGAAAGFTSGLLTKLVYWVEDLYRKLPLHWMWWPALGGLLVGLGGLIDPRALGVGYPTIRALDDGQVLVSAALLLFMVKAVIWIGSLSSGTSGGVLAPLLLLGGALGTLLSPLFPGHLVGVWATMGMAAMLGGTMRAPLTATIFTMETTHAWPLLLPVFIASSAGMAVTVLWIPRSILTEKVSRRGVHVAREYSVHPLEGQAVSDVMVARHETVAFPTTARVSDVAQQILTVPKVSYASYPVVDSEGRVVGVVSRMAILYHHHVEPDSVVPLHALAKVPIAISDRARVRTAVEHMARHGRDALLVVNRQSDWVGWITHHDAMKTWRRALEAEERREPVLRVPWARTSWDHHHSRSL